MKENTLRNLLSEAFDGSRGEPTNFVDNEPQCGLLDTLDSLSAQQASSAAAKGRRTIAGHVMHLQFSFDTTMRWLRGNREAIDWSQSWRGDTVTDEQ